MKTGFSLFLGILFIANINAQKKERTKDTVKTEVVNIVTSYNPKISDATKIKVNPIIKLSETHKKQALQHRIFSVPAASTFVPKSGVVKGIDVGVKERLYNNYVALGYGNYNTPYAEAFLHYNSRFKNEMGLHTKYIASLQGIANTALNSTYRNFYNTLFYKQHAHYFNWKTTLNFHQNAYNWYGVPNTTTPNNALKTLDSEQVYQFVQLLGDLDFDDSFIKKSQLNIAFFSDKFKSNEILLKLNTTFDFPLDFINYKLNNIHLDTKFELLKGDFKTNYTDNTAINYNIFTAKIQPKYNFSFWGFDVKTSLKLFTSIDTENSVTNLFIYPDVAISKSIIKNYLQVYTEFTGDLKTNSYKNFTDENPFVAPSLFITQTSEKQNISLGLNGRIASSVSFNLKANYKNEEDKPFFLKNNSKTTSTNSSSLKGYEYGNSYKVFYDDVITKMFLGEVDIVFNKQLNTALRLQYSSYEVTNLSKAFNLPELEANLHVKFKNKHWYATTNAFYVGERNVIDYNTTFPSNTFTPSVLSSFIDVNMNGGYHFNDQFSVFLKLNNILNTNYQRFANFNVQGFQALGGITYKFDF